MSINHVTPIDIAISGLQAQSKRLNVIANNIANAHTSRTQTGRPFRRREVLLSTAGKDLAGVEVGGVTEDVATDFHRVYQPGHPDADEKGFLLMPNVEVPLEMVHMLGASRAYEANAAVLKRYQELIDATLELLR